MTYVYVFIGGGLGAIARHGVGVGAMRLFGPGFPWGTFVVNVLGSFAMGLLVGALTLRDPSGQTAKLFAATGFLGGFTTFSAFSLDLATMLERGQIALLLAYAVGSVSVSLVAVFAGLAVLRG